MRKKWLLYLILAWSGIQAQETIGQKKQHLSFADTFFGNEDDYQVCYPKEHRMFFYGIFAASSVALSFLGIIIYLKNKHNRSLKKINEEISHKNKEILDSINYAQRIQESILPEKNKLEKEFKNVGVFYQPRDIVSGDLYWIHKNENGTFLAVIDCTGHGVPGAFLSLLAHNAIEHAILEKKLVNTAEILDTMNNYVKAALNQGDCAELKDGMEVGLCRITNSTAYYSGANIKLKYTSKGVFQEIAATKCTVGSVQTHVSGPPETHTLQLQKGDRLFMHSDGIVDQFGGTEYKKFTSKKLNALIQNTASDDLQNQLRILSDAFRSWKGQYEQTDDVLLAILEIE